MTTTRSFGTDTPGTETSRGQSAASGARALLACGVAAGPLFALTALVQMLTRDGFDAVLHPISLLSNGDLGWVQVSNFVVSGLLFAAAGVGMRRVLGGTPGGTWGPRLIGIMGLAMVAGGVFVADAAGGFPPGTPPGPPEHFSWHSILHSFAPPVAYLAAAAAGLVFARRFRTLGNPGWATYSLLTAVVSEPIAIAAFPLADFRLLFAGGVLQWTWASILSMRLMAEIPTAHVTRAAR